MKKIAKIFIIIFTASGLVFLLSNCEVNPEPETPEQFDFMISKVVEEYDSVNGVWYEAEVVDNITEARVGDKIRFTLTTDPTLVDFVSIWPGDSTHNYFKRNYFEVTNDLEFEPAIGRGFSLIDTHDFTYDYPSEGNSEDGKFTVVLVATNMSVTLARAVKEKQLTILPELEEGE